MPMLSLSLPRPTKLLLLVGVTAMTIPSSTANNNNNNNNNAHPTFVYNKAASTSAGTRKIELDYLSSPAWGWSMKEILSLKSTVVRFHDELEFTPSYNIVDGSDHCRAGKTDDFFTETPESDICKNHCMNAGRYCDHSLVDNDEGTTKDGLAQARKEFFKTHNVQGSQLVEESVRRLCLWDLYGVQDNRPDKFFEYHENMQATKCDAKLTPDCIEAALPAGVNAARLYQCVHGDKGLDPELDEPHALLESVLKRNKDYKFEAGRVTLFTDGESYLTTNFDPSIVFGEVCGEFTINLQVDPPLVCDFCNHYCPGQKPKDYHTKKNECAWDLICPQNGDSFQTYMSKVHSNITEEEYLSQVLAQKDANRKDPNFAGNVKVPAHSSSSSSSGGKTVVETAGGMAATLLAMILAGGVFMMAVMAIRVWRTKVIIERYVREQEELSLARARNDHGGEYGDHNHHDDAFFPDGNELDLDLEPALQYRDHIIAPGGGGSGNGGDGGRSSGPPSSAAFLPKLT